MSLLPPGTCILSCRVFEPELMALGVRPDQAVFLDQGLHRYPCDLRTEVAAELSRLEAVPSVRRVLLGYGYCGGGLEGLSSQRVDLWVPRVHDCIALLLGYTPVDCRSFYLSPGWVDYGQTPLTEHQRTAERFGEEDALWVGRELLKGYDEVVLVRTIAGLLPHHRSYASKMARLFDLELRETSGDPDRLRHFLNGSASDQAIVLAPRQSVKAAMFQRPEGAGDNL
jgi:hypothetical protein